MSYDSVPQMGIPVHHRDLEGVLEAIDGFILAGRQTGKSHQIVTVNTDFLVQARKHADVHAILRSADLALPDGMPIVWASGALGQRLPGRVAGADLVPALAERAEKSGYRMMFFGGTGDVAQRAARELRAVHPELDIAATTAVVGPAGATDAEILDEIRGFRPDVICVGLGHPKQERWIRRYARTLGVPVAVGVGGTFDFIAGHRRRAAPWIQRSGFEWLYRLAQEPGRLTRRYMSDIAIYVPSVTLQILRTRVVRASNRRDELTAHGSRASSGTGVVPVRSDSDSLLVEVRRPGALDHHTVAELTSLATSTRLEGRTLQLVAPDLEAIRSLEKLRLDRLIRLVPRSPRQAVGDDAVESHPADRLRTTYPRRPHRTAKRRQLATHERD